MELADVWRSSSHLRRSFHSALTWCFPHSGHHLAVFPPVVPLSHIQPGLPLLCCTHTCTNGKDERRRVAPLPALQQVAQTNWQQQMPQKKHFSPRDLSAVLTSNFIFIDHSLFSSIWSVAARRAFDILPCTIKVDNMPLWQKSKSMFSWIHPAFERLILLWKVYIYVVSSVGKELTQHSGA